MMDVAELRDLTVGGAARPARRSSRISSSGCGMQQSLGQLDAPLKLRFTRRDLARVKTMISARNSEGEGVDDGMRKLKR